MKLELKEPSWCEVEREDCERRTIGVLPRISDGGIAVTLRIDVKRNVGHLASALSSLRCLVGIK